MSNPGSLTVSFVRVVWDEMAGAELTSVRALAQRSGIKERTLRCVLSGRQAVHLDQVQAIAVALGYKASELVAKAEERRITDGWVRGTDGRWTLRPRTPARPPIGRRRPWAARL